MKALVQDGYGSADVLHLREIEKPVVTEGRVLVRVHAASVNALDWHSVHGGLVIRAVGSLMRQQQNPVLGVDFAGVVEAVGPNVTRFAPGDAVFGGAPAAFAEYTCAREGSLVQKPRDLSFEQAAAIGVAGRTALQGLRDIGQVKPGQRVLICGAGGGVGTFAVQIAKALGAHVTAVTSTRNLELVRALGPDEVIDYTNEDFTRRAERYDVVFDVAGDCGFGALQAAGIRGVRGIGVDDDLSYLGPHILASAVKRGDRAVELAVRLFLSGTLPGGRDVHLGLGSGSIGLVGISGRVPLAARAKLEQVAGALRAHDQAAGR